MSTFPAVTGSKLIKVLEKRALKIFANEAVIISSNTLTGDARLFLSTAERRSGAVFLHRSSRTANSPEKKSTKSLSEPANSATRPLCDLK